LICCTLWESTTAVITGRRYSASGFFVLKKTPWICDFSRVIVRLFPVREQYPVDKIKNRDYPGAGQYLFAPATHR
jgi:hypothetical protein